ncbi:MAG: hypothetical protein KA004_01130 [Verrucomicrobiales bacterium]|nr:hypothetical protein [Verrucomicrobiales bacterium]
MKTPSFRSPRRFGGLAVFAGLAGLVCAADRVPNNWSHDDPEVIDAHFGNRLSPMRWDSLSADLPVVQITTDLNGVQTGTSPTLSGDGNNHGLPFPGTRDAGGWVLMGETGLGFIFDTVRLNAAQFDNDGPATSGAVKVKMVIDEKRDSYHIERDEQGNVIVCEPAGTSHVITTREAVVTFAQGQESQTLPWATNVDPDGPATCDRSLDLWREYQIFVDPVSLNSPDPDPDDSLVISRLTSGKKYCLQISALAFDPMVVFHNGYQQEPEGGIGSAVLVPPAGSRTLTINGVTPEWFPGESQLHFVVAGKDQLPAGFVTGLGALVAPLNPTAATGNYSLEFWLIDRDADSIFGSAGSAGVTTTYQNCVFQPGVTLLGETTMLGATGRAQGSLSAQKLQIPPEALLLDAAGNPLLQGTAPVSAPYLGQSAVFSLSAATAQAISDASQDGVSSRSIASIISSGAGGIVGVGAGAGLTAQTKAAIVAAGAGFDSSTVTGIIAAGAGNPALPPAAVGEIVGSGAGGGLSGASLDAILATHNVTGLHVLTKAAIVAAGAGFTAEAVQKIAIAGGGIVAPGAGGGIVAPGAGYGLTSSMSASIVAAGAGGIVAPGAGVQLPASSFSTFALLEGKVLPNTMASQLAGIVAAGAGGISVSQINNIVASGAGGGVLQTASELVNKPSGLLAADLFANGATREVMFGETSGNFTLGSAASLGVGTFSRLLAPGNSPGSAKVFGTAHFAPTAVFDVEIYGLNGDILADGLDVTQSAMLGGKLQVSLWEGAAATPGFADRTFTIIRCPDVSGSFSNGPPGGRIATAGGEGTFLVSHTAAGVTLSAYQPLPAGPPHTLAAWKAHFGISAVADTVDSDGDGLTVLAEFAYGTDPTVPSAPPVTHFFQSSEVLTCLPVDTRKTGLRYLVQSSSDLATWQTAYDSATDATLRPGIVESRLSSTAHDGPMRFVRTKILTVP